MWGKAGAVFLSALALVATSSEVHAGQAADTTVTLDSVLYGHEATLFLGLVSSERGRCERGRAIEVYRVVDGPDSFIGTGSAGDRNGTGREWSLEVSGYAANGFYYAKAPATPRCKADRSPKYELISCMPVRRGQCRAAPRD